MGTNKTRHAIPASDVTTRRRVNSQQSVSVAALYVSLIVLPFSCPLGAIFGMLPEMLAHMAWAALSVESTDAGVHIGGNWLPMTEATGA